MSAERRLNRDEVVQILRLVGCKHFLKLTINERSLYSMRSVILSQEDSEGWEDARV